MIHYGTRNWFDEGRLHGYGRDDYGNDHWSARRHAGKSSQSSIWFALGGTELAGTKFAAPSDEEESPPFPTPKQPVHISSPPVGRYSHDAKQRNAIAKERSNEASALTRSLPTLQPAASRHVGVLHDGGRPSEENGRADQSMQTSDLAGNILLGHDLTAMLGARPRTLWINDGRA